VPHPDRSGISYVAATFETNLFFRDLVVIVTNNVGEAGEIVVANIRNRRWCGWWRWHPGQQLVVGSPQFLFGSKAFSFGFGLGFSTVVIAAEISGSNCEGLFFIRSTVSWRWNPKSVQNILL